MSNLKTVITNMLGALTTVGIIACQDPFGVDGARHDLAVGRVTFNHHPVEIAIPDSVLAGEEFSVTVRTFGGGCKRQGPSGVAVSGLRADITPFDYFDVELKQGYVCTSDLRFYPHSVTLEFAQPGTAIVRIHGRAYPGDTAITIDRPVIVRPR